ncbi:hypothetical protein ACIQWL_06510 [Streptomyces mirabilis]|uniref:hypothetical protein n=1 Tax=Streptomyces TaxID=1883 RepID=UPI000A4FF46E|nr:MULTISPECIES: hypothetical protein [Streptomyces]MCX4424076.1 hypothetical protein [Streptomyces mirabilis]
MLDDYQGVATEVADRSPVATDVEVTPVGRPANPWPPAAPQPPAHPQRHDFD